MTTALHLCPDNNRGQTVPIRSHIDRWLHRWLLWGLLALVAPAVAQPVPIGPSHPGAWLVFLCQPSDDATVPKGPAFFQALFDKNEPDLLYPYFRQISHGNLDVSDATVLGWFKMNVSTADISPATRNNSTNPNRSQTIKDCQLAGLADLLSRGRTVDVGRFAGFIAIVNVPVDAGHAGSNTVVANHYEPASFYQHEMLHAMGQINHTRNLRNDPTADHAWGSPNFVEYDDPWDIMSYNVGIFSYQSARHGQTGPELNAAYRAERGWLPGSMTVTKTVRRDADRTPLRVRLAPVSEPQANLPLLVVVDLPAGVRYVVEHRKATGFDRGLIRGEVVVREWRSDQATYLVRQQNGHIGFFPGEPPFTDLGNRLRITVNTIDQRGADVLIETNVGSGTDRSKVAFTRLPSPMRLGDSGMATVRVTNTGQRTWEPSKHAVAVKAIGSVVASPVSIDLSLPLGPGQPRSFSFEVTCAAFGKGSIDVFMTGPGGAAIPDGVKRTLACRR